MPGTTSTRRRPDQHAPAPLRASDPSASLRAIRQHAEREGYVFCRGLVPRVRIDALRRHVLTVAAELGWLDAETPVDTARGVDGVRLGAYDDPRWIAFLERVLPHPAFEAVRVAPGVIDVLTAILGAPPQPDAGDLCRVVSSDDPDHTTVAHQDRFYLPGGAPRWSVWVPLSACPLALGPLAVLPRSHPRGLLPHAGEAVWRQSVDVADGAPWAASDLAPGDAIFFSWLTVHRALANVSGRALRLSATFRYRAAHPGAAR
jgi:ectoine hydroxylase-related dioxygenase (phytanoyl-CoA dioxygenase family)